MYQLSSRIRKIKTFLFSLCLSHHRTYVPCVRSESGAVGVTCHTIYIFFISFIYIFVRNHIINFKYIMHTSYLLVSKIFNNSLI